MLTQVESRTIIESLREELRALRADYEALIAAREALARAEERAACAALAQEYADGLIGEYSSGEYASGAALRIAAAIRARGSVTNAEGE